GLGAETFGTGTNRLHDIHDRAHLLFFWIELDEPGVCAIGMSADVESAVVAFDDREIAFALGGGLLGNGVGRGLEPIRFGFFRTGERWGAQEPNDESPTLHG